MDSCWSYYVFKTMIKAHAKGKRTMLVADNGDGVFRKLRFRVLCLVRTITGHKDLVPHTLITREEYGHHFNNAIKMGLPVRYLGLLLTNYYPTVDNIRTSLVFGRSDIVPLLLQKTNTCDIDVCLIQVPKAVADDFCAFQRKRLQQRLSWIFAALPDEVCDRISAFVATCSMHKDHCKGKTYLCNV